MTPPIEYAIVADVQGALHGIAVAAGYHADLAATAVKLDPNHKIEDLIAPGGPRPFAILEVLPGSWAYDESPLQVTRILPITVHYITDSDPTDDTSRIRVFFESAADVERAIAGDVTRSGLASLTTIKSTNYDTNPDGSQIWTRMELEILYRRTFGAPDL